MAAASKIPKTTLIYLTRVERFDGQYQPETRLTDINKEPEVRFDLSFVHLTTLQFDCMYDRFFLMYSGSICAKRRRNSI